MKALKSQLASSLLADPDAKGQLRQYLMNKRNGKDARASARSQFTVRQSDGTLLKIHATVVPKASE